MSYSRISSDINNFSFVGDSNELDEDALDLLADIADDLARHPALRARIMVFVAQDESEETESGTSRLDVIRNLFTEEFKISEDRLALSAIDDEDMSNTAQIFLKRES